MRKRSSYVREGRLEDPSNFGLTHAERLLRGLPLPGEGPAPKMRYTPATFLARNEKLVKTLLAPPKEGGSALLNSPAMRARRACGHLLVIANVLTRETPTAIMDRLGISEIDRARLGEFKAETIWSVEPASTSPAEPEPWE